MLLPAASELTRPASRNRRSPCQWRSLTAMQRVLPFRVQVRTQCFPIAPEPARNLAARVTLPRELTCRRDLLGLFPDSQISRKKNIDKRKTNPPVTAEYI